MVRQRVQQQQQQQQQLQTKVSDGEFPTVGAAAPEQSKKQKEKEAKQKAKEQAAQQAAAAAAANSAHAQVMCNEWNVICNECTKERAMQQAGRVG